MVKKQLLYRAAAATVLGLSLTTGVASAHTYNNHHNNNNGGNKSLTADLSANVSNVGVDNMTDQTAVSGPATVTGGSSHNNGDRHHDSNSSSDNSAKTGDANNGNTTKVVVVGDQSSAAPAAGPSNSNNGGNHNNGGNTNVDVSASLNVSNVEVGNSTEQTAVSGPATVTGNNKGGSAKTGDASNSNSTTIVVKGSQQ